MTTYWFDRLPLHPAPEPLESFSGYLIRLAELNQMDTVSGLGYALFPRARYRPQDQGWYMDVPLKVFEQMPEATGCSPEQLQATTVYHLLFKFGHQDAYPFLRTQLVAYLRYCPACLEEQPYHRLTWRFLVLPGCVRHAGYLLDRCGHCGQRIPLIPYRPLRVGRCPVCGGDLRTCPTETLSSADGEVTVKRTADLDYLLTPQPWENDPGCIVPSSRTWLQFLRREQQLSEVSIARRLHVATATVRGMESSARRQEVALLETYLKYADVLGTTWREIFEHMAQQFRQTPADAFQLRSASLLKQVEQAIQHLEQTGQRVSKAAIAQLVGLSYECLGNYAGVDQVMQQLPAYVRQRQEQQWLAAVQAAAEHLRAQGQAVTQTALHRLVPGCPSSTRQFPAVTALVEQLSTPTPYKQTLDDKRQRDEVYLQQAQQIVRDLEAIGRRVTLIAVAGMLDLAPHQIVRYPQLTAWLNQTLEHHRQQERQRQEADLVIRVQAAIQQLEAEGRSVTQGAIAQILEMSPGRLRKYPAVKALLPRLQRL